MNDLLPHDDLEDFDSEDLDMNEDDEDPDYLNSMWGAFADASNAQKLLIAHGMVKSFVNAFARDGAYTVTFDPNVGSASTAMKSRQVMLTPSPILDTRITAQDAGRVLTGMAVHEISHPRYGKRTRAAIQSKFGMNSAALRISNILDDVRIERRFAHDYPGYAGVFAPTMAYLVRDQKIVPTIDDPLNLLCAAIRYPDSAQVTWNDATLVERDYWRTWSDRWAKEDAPSRHVIAVTEALDHIANIPPESTGEMPNGSDGSGECGKGRFGADGRLAPPAKRVPALPSCADNKAVDKASGQNPYDISHTSHEAEQAVQRADFLEEGVEVRRDPSCILSGTKHAVRQNEYASRFIRDGILQSSSGHENVTRYQKRGRLDQHGLHRIASGDFRCFDRKHSPSPDKFLIWLLIDCSGSMRGYPIAQAADVAATIAAATKFVPTVRLNVWGWTSSWTTGVAGGAASIWKSGDALNKIGNLTKVPMGATPDKTVLSWASKAIAREARPNETPLIILCSDGQGYSGLNETVEEAAEHGVIIRSVAIGEINAVQQAEDFGPDGFITWQGSISQTARPLGKMIAKMVTRTH